MHIGTGDNALLLDSRAYWYSGISAYRGQPDRYRHIVFGRTQIGVGLVWGKGQRSAPAFLGLSSLSRAASFEQVIQIDLAYPYLWKHIIEQGGPVEPPHYIGQRTPLSPRHIDI